MGSSVKPRIGPRSVKAKWNNEKTRKGISKPIIGTSQKTGILEQLYFVEKIIKKKFEDGVPKYLIKWDGYPSSVNTWEPAQHIPMEMVKDFEDDVSYKTKVPLGPIQELVINTDENSPKTNGYIIRNVFQANRSESETDYIEAKDKDNEIHTIPLAKNLQDKIVSRIETVTRKTLKSNPNGEPRLIFIMRFEGFDKAEAVIASDAYAIFPREIIQYFESIITFS